MSRLAWVLPLLFLLWGCGDKTEKYDIWGSDPTLEIPPLSYVPVYPIWRQYQDPTDVYAGFDDHIYVVDAGTEEVIAYNFSFDEEQAIRLSIPGARAVAQDLRLNLLVIGRAETTINNVTYDLPAIYRLKPNSLESYTLNDFSVVDTLIHPFYYNRSVSTALLPDAEKVQFNDIDVIGNNNFYVTRSGPVDNERLSIGMGPDDAVLYFNKEGEFQQEIVVFDPLLRKNVEGFFRTPYGITTRTFPTRTAQSNSESRDFIVTFAEEGVPRKANYIGYFEDPNNSYYYFQDLQEPEDPRIRGIYDLGLFEKPLGIAFTQENIFVVDAAKDSVYQFNTITSNPNGRGRGGEEGIRPTRADGSLGPFTSVSFGGTGSGPTNFVEPTAVAFLQDFLFVVDRNNQRVIKYKLTTDL